MRIISENNLDEPCVRCVRRKVRDIRSPIFLFSFPLFINYIHKCSIVQRFLDWVRLA